MIPDWSGQTVYVVASGQSAADIVPHIPPAARVIAVNRSYELVPQADILYGADTGFWLVYPAARAFAGLKLCPDIHVKRICSAVQVVQIKRHKSTMQYERDMVRAPPGVIGFGGNSGFQAVNIAAQTRPARICLVGFDYVGSHWHPDHPPGLRNPGPGQLRWWCAELDRQAPLLASWGIDVVNLSPISALRGFCRADCRLLDQGPAALQA